MRVLHSTRYGRGRLSAALLVALVFSAAMIAGAAEAGWFGKNKDEAPKTITSHRFNRLPTLTFSQGTLHAGALGGWQLDEKAVQLTKDCLVTQEGRDGGILQAGRPAIGSGTVVGNMIFATHIHMLEQGGSTGLSQVAGVVKQPSETNPSVGILEQAPH